MLLCAGVDVRIARAGSVSLFVLVAHCGLSRELVLIPTAPIHGECRTNRVLVAGAPTLLRSGIFGWTALVWQAGLARQQQLLKRGFLDGVQLNHWSEIPVRSAINQLGLLLFCSERF